MRQPVLPGKLPLVELTRPRPQLRKAFATAGKLGERPGNSGHVVASDADPARGAGDEAFDVAVGADIECRDSARHVTLQLARHNQSGKGTAQRNHGNIRDSEALGQALGGQQVAEAHDCAKAEFIDLPPDLLKAATASDKDDAQRRYGIHRALDPLQQGIELVRQAEIARVQHHEFPLECPLLAQCIGSRRCESLSPGGPVRYLDDARRR